MSEPQYPDFTAHGYQVIEQLGRNPSAGRVSYKALSINTGQIVVIKQFQWVGGSSTLDGERQIGLFWFSCVNFCYKLKQANSLSRRCSKLVNP
ncbi:MAG: hypothetical protein IM496_10630 [Microcystis sp. M049S2]|jgi:hypothetical protein|nr:hypothetical protein [Microcystis sp. M049S2]